MGFVKTLEEITAEDAPRAGGKAYNCARLRQAGFPVPGGFVLLSDAPGGPALSRAVEEALRRWPKETLFAVRSSAADEDHAGHSFAGIHETKLNVPHASVMGAVEACKASVRSPQALAYRRTQGLSLEDIRTGVLVQAMIKPVVAGVAFTINPVTGAAEELVINATWGLGEALVGGYVEPDEFRLRKTDGTLLASHIGGKLYRVLSDGGVSRLVETSEDERARPSLNREQLQELASLLRELEEHYGAPQDVEWGHDGEQFWIVQSRPVTGMAQTLSPTLARHGRDLEWTRANAREVLPDLPSPQVLAALDDILNRSMLAYYGRLAAPVSELGPIMKTFYGRPYFNLSQFRHVCRMTGGDPASVMRAIGHEGEIKPEDEVAARPPLGPLLRALPDLLRIGWRQLTVGQMVRRWLAEIEEDMALLDAHDPRAMTDAEIVRFLQRWEDTTEERMAVIFVMSGVVLYETELKKICGRVGFPPERLIHTYLATGEKSVSAQQALDLLSLAHRARSEERARDYFQKTERFDRFREALRGTRFLEEFELFLQKYGHRGNYESDWALPRYSEDPEPLLFAIGVHVQAPDCPAPEAIIARQEREAREAWQEFEAKLSRWQKLLLVPRVRWLLKRAKKMYVWRELCRSEMVRLTSAIRAWLLVMAERFVERGLIAERDDYFFLTGDEIKEGFDDAERAAQFRSIVAARKADLESWRHLELPLLMRESELPALLRRATSAGALTRVGVRELRGLCVSAGCAEGEVLVMRDASEFARMKRGAILVAPATDPSWTPLFTLASGVIVEVGGTLSHAATVAREYGLPALANLKDATKLLGDGDRVRLDATNGLVEILGRHTQETDVHQRPSN
ncbi:MAG TPA: PEP/pyruvate-binding domain-containing protein [Pyrinomonadaceae bacterium]|jgi:pyruvate,water dikinase